MQPFWVLPYALRHRAGRLAHEAQVASSCCCISSCRAVCPFHFFFEALCSIFACPLSGRVPDFFFGLGFNRAMCRFLFAFGLCYWHVILLPRPSFCTAHVYCVAMLLAVLAKSHVHLPTCDLCGQFVCFCC